MIFFREVFFDLAGPRPWNVNSATADLSRFPRPMDSNFEYCPMVASARGSFNLADRPSFKAIPESLAACDAEK